MYMYSMHRITDACLLVNLIIIQYNDNNLKRDTKILKQR